MNSKTKEPKELLNNYLKGMKDLSYDKQDIIKSFEGLLQGIYAKGNLDIKTKELISIGISTYTNCEYTIVYHVNQALKAGATKEEIIEASLVSVAFGGITSMSYAVTLIKESIEAFS
ncbi:MAG: carboxymuconolactone decarboxylase family protein [Eubacteriaceae bacterium]